MSEIFILIPGRTLGPGSMADAPDLTRHDSRETAPLHAAPPDMQRLKLASGDLVRLTSTAGQIEVAVTPAHPDELPPGLLFLSAVDLSRRLIDGDTHATGLPTSQAIDVSLERVAAGSSLIAAPGLSSASPASTAGLLDGSAVEKDAAVDDGTAADDSTAAGNVATADKDSTAEVESAASDASEGSAEEITIQDATCTRCGCVCDDIRLKVRHNRIVEAHRACDLGRPWFLNREPDQESACVIEGHPASVEAGIQRAAQILAEARSPLVYGLRDTTSGAQRATVGIADWIGANLDTTTSLGYGPASMAMQRVGQVTCTLGEIKNRSDLIIFWGTNPVESHPRHFERYSLTAPGTFLPGGRSDRTAVLVDVRRTASAREVDHFIPIRPRTDFEALWTLRALAKGLELDSQRVELSTGVPLETWQSLMRRMMQARYGAILFGTGLTMTRGKHLNCEALLGLTRDMNDHTRFVCLAMGSGGNAAGADQVVTWRTGYPFGVNLARGYPRYNPGEYTATDTLIRGEADAALIVAADPMSELNHQAREHLGRIPTVVLDSSQTPCRSQATVAIRTSTYGIHTPGTVYRMDDVPIPLRPALHSPLPSDEDILQELERQVRALTAERNRAS